MSIEDSNVLKYPFKKIIFDVVERNNSKGIGVFDIPEFEEEDLGPFTPFPGCRRLLDAKILWYGAAFFNEDVFKERLNEEFDSSRCNARSIFNADTNGISDLEGERTDFLEEIDSEYVDKYINGLLSRVDKHDSFSDVRSGKHMVSQVTTDDDTGQRIYVEKIYDERPGESRVEDRRDNKNEIVKQLDILHQGSIRLGTSLLSLLIARERAIRTNGSASIIKGSVVPRELLQSPIWKVDIQGNYISKWDPETANADRKFTRVKNIILGNPESLEDAVYNESADTLCRLFDIMGWDISKEKADMYTPESLNKIRHFYVFSNYEIIRYSALNQNEAWTELLTSTCSLMPIGYEESNKSVSTKSYILGSKQLILGSLSTFITNSIMDKKSVNFKELGDYRDLSGKLNDKQRMSDSVSFVKRFIMIYNLLCGYFDVEGDDRVIRYDECKIIDSVVCDHKGDPIIFQLYHNNKPMPHFHEIPFIRNLPVCVISTLGFITYLDSEIDDCVKIFDIRDAFYSLLWYTHLALGVKYKKDNKPPEDNEVLLSVIKAEEGAYTKYGKMVTTDKSILKDKLKVFYI